MSSKFCKNQFVQLILFRFFHNKIIYYFLLFTLTLFSTIFESHLRLVSYEYYFVWRNLPTNSNYFTKIYLLFSVTLVIKQ